MPGGARSLRSISVRLASAAMMLLTACRSHDGSSASGAATTTLRVGLSQVLSNPTQGITSLAQVLTVESLARLADDGRPQPALARDWQISEDRKSLTVNLSPAVTFHDG